MDGPEVCRQLKASEKTRTIPVIFISVLEDERSKIKGFQAGAAGQSHVDLFKKS